MMLATSGSCNFVKCTIFLLFLFAKFNMPDAFWPSITRHFNLFTVSLMAWERWLICRNFLLLNGCFASCAPTSQAVVHGIRGAWCELMLPTKTLPSVEHASHVDSSRIFSVRKKLSFLLDSTSVKLFLFLPLLLPSFVKDRSSDCLLLTELFLCFCLWERFFWVFLLLSVFSY